MRLVLPPNRCSSSAQMQLQTAYDLVMWMSLLICAGTVIVRDWAGAKRFSEWTKSGVGLWMNRVASVAMIFNFDWFVFIRAQRWIASRAEAAH